MSRWWIKRVAARAVLISASMALSGDLMAAAARFPMDATTPDGKSVTLYEDGTWRPKTLELSHSVIRKSDFATARYGSRLGFYEFMVDPKLWSPMTGSAKSAEFQFQNKSGEAWCEVFATRIQMTQDSVLESAVRDMQAADKSGKVIQTSVAFVNALRGNVFEWRGTVQGVVASFYTFVWSGAPGSVQLTCWTSANLANEYRSAFNDFFGGLLLAE